MNRLRAFGRWYNGLLERRPVATKVITTLVLAGAADMTSQRLVWEPTAESPTWRWFGEGGDVPQPAGNGAATPGRVDGGTDGGRRETDAPRGSSSAAIAAVAASGGGPQIGNKATWDVARTVRMSVGMAALVTPVMHWWYLRLEAAIPAAGAATVVKKIALDQLVFLPVMHVVFFSTQVRAWCVAKRDAARDIVMKWMQSVVMSAPVSLISLRQAIAAGRPVGDSFAVSLETIKTSGALLWMRGAGAQGAGHAAAFFPCVSFVVCEPCYYDDEWFKARFLVARPQSQTGGWSGSQPR